MTEFILNCIQSGAYSAIFAVLLVYTIKNGARREKFYRAFISELTERLKLLGEVNVKVDSLVAIAEAVAKPPKKRPKAEYVTAACEGVPAYDG